MQRETRLPPLDLLAAFESAARHRSFTLAGAERFVTQSAISRQIRALEDQLGVALFRRRHRALELTVEGEKLLATCTSVLSQLRTTLAALNPANRREVLALTTTPGFASLWLIPRLAGFTRDHPGVDVRIEAALDLRDLPRDGFDLAVRYCKVDTREGHALFPEAMLPVCAPALLRNGPRLAEPADLSRHTLLQMESNMPTGLATDWKPWLHAMGLSGLEPRALLSFTTYSEAAAAALAGQGVLLGRRPLIDALLKRRQLVAPFPEQAASQRGYFLVVDPSSRQRPAVRAFEAWLLDQASESAATA